MLENTPKGKTHVGGVGTHYHLLKEEATGEGAAQSRGDEGAPLGATQSILDGNRSLKDHACSHGLQSHAKCVEFSFLAG